MKHLTRSLLCAASIGGLILCLSGCSTTPKNGHHLASKYRAPDGRTVEIGHRMPTDSGWSFAEPHMDKCWIASDFDLNGYDTILIAPTLSITQARTSGEERLNAMARENIVIEMTRYLRMRGIFANVITKETDLKPGAHFLKLVDTITEFDPGDFRDRYWGGMFGAGQPVIRVSGKMTDGDKTVFTYEARRSGVSAEAHMAVMPTVDIQIEDVRSLSLDVTDFMAAIAGKYKPKN